ncbi:hypothetical protein H3V53_42295 [Paraburkholderia bengalensis]|uniref:Uncharacterized protein n=1 Tax=Paraburkholderia bengalensis TaxID=2747562 RepID=A0ABU8J724_9BURK
MPGINVRGRHLLYRQFDFQLELSRGASCIASCQTDESLRQEVQSTVLSFLETHGPASLEMFRDVLAVKLSARGRRDAAMYVASYPVQPQATV